MQPQRRRGYNRRKFIRSSLAGVIGAGVITPRREVLGNQAPSEERLKIREYRTLGRTGFKVSDIGMGASFLSNANVLEAALDMGMNYLDTGEHYGRGLSERTIGEVLKKRERKKIFVSTKLNLLFGGGATREILKERFQKCLERLQTDYADCLMIHMTSTADQVKHEGFHAACRELKAEGRIRFIGLSNHGLEQRIYGNAKDPMEKVLFAAADDGRFDVALFVYNFLQKEQGEKIIDACSKKNIGVTLMKTNPVKVFKRWNEGLERAEAEGRELPERILTMRKDYMSWLAGAEEFKRKYGLKSDQEVRDAAIRFVLSHQGVHSVCPSINSFEELEAFVRLSGRKLSLPDKAMLQDYQSALGSFYCRHACGLCEPHCPHQVPVNTVMRYNHYFEAQEQEKYAMAKYAELPGPRADLCRGCSGECEAHCPYSVPVRGLLVAAHENLTLS
jgi:predicted aldo/keto reductase-like oxidoreductase